MSIVMFTVATSLTVSEMGFSSLELRCSSRLLRKLSTTAEVGVWSRYSSLLMRSGSKTFLSTTLRSTFLGTSHGIKFTYYKALTRAEVLL